LALSARLAQEGKIVTRPVSGGLHSAYRRMLLANRKVLWIKSWERMILINPKASKNSGLLDFEDWFMYPGWLPTKSF